eukprot:m.218497 g.218497  ORF g.218497 m.218497 type:complete len:486 (+) comp33269_c1_seq1:302-1759(+)
MSGPQTEQCVRVSKVSDDAGASKGCGVLSKRAMKRPSVLVAFSRPDAYVLTDQHRMSRCFHCLATPDTLKTCTGCRHLQFCGKQCQRAAWPSHKSECRSLQKILHKQSPSQSPSQPPSLLLLLARLLRGVAAGSISETKIQALSSQPETVEDSLKDKFAELLQMLKMFELDGETLAMESAMDMLCKVSSNSFSICDSELQNIGTGVYTDVACFNHSCRPNCAAVFEGLTLKIRTILPVDANEELTISYIDIKLPTIERRILLSKQYSFICTCKRCVSGGFSSKPNNDKQLRALLCRQKDCHSTMFPLVEFGPRMGEFKCNGCGFVEDVQERIAKFIKMCDNFGSKTEVSMQRKKELLQKELALAETVLAPTHHRVCSILNSLTDACVALGDWETAYIFAKRSTKALRDAVPPESPTLGVELARIAKLCHYLGHLNESVAAFESAVEILTNSHGASHMLVCDLQVRLAQAKNEVHHHHQQHESKLM